MLSVFLHFYSVEMPDLIQAGTTIALSDSEQKAYLEFEKEQLLEIDEAEIEALSGKGDCQTALLQRIKELRKV